jgi:superfamily II DNA helicase RecQ
MMRVKVFTLRYDAGLGSFNDTDMRRFLADKQLLRCSEQFFLYDGVPHIAVLCVYSTEMAELTSLDPSVRGAGKETADPQEGMSEIEMRLYDSLREWRTAKAFSEGIPVFLIASNSMLAELVRARPGSLSGIRELNGFGEAKVKRYGAELLGMLGGADIHG